MLLTAAYSEPPNHRDTHEAIALADRIAAIDARIIEIDKMLSKEFPDYAAMTSPEPLSIIDVQAQLRADEVLVLFLGTPEQKPLPEETFIWVVTKTDMRWVRSELGTSSLTREVGALRCGLDHALWKGGEAQDRCVEMLNNKYSYQLSVDGLAADVLPFDLERAHTLYKALLGPVEDLIKDKHLLVVPSGPLTSLPFSVLVTEPPRARMAASLAEYREVAWLATRQPITVLPSVASLKALRQFAKTSRASKPYLGIGNPLLDGPQDHPQWGEHYKKQAEAARSKQQCPRTVRQRIALVAARPLATFTKLFRGGQADIDEVRRWTPLPETADELCEVARRLIVPDREVLLGSRATEAALKDMSEKGRLADYAILHFATHGALTGRVERLAEPGLVLTPPPSGTSDARALQRDDGFLTASEIATLKLDADWVILSACNTAGASGETAEPLSGMARAFFYAGARALLVSHWEVGSDAAVKLTTRAFVEMNANPKIGRAEAFRVSMRALIEKGSAFEAHPSQWAPFVVVGEGAAASGRK
jgi:CHAT domain-containing protein